MTNQEKTNDLLSDKDLIYLSERDVFIKEIREEKEELKFN